MDIRSAITQYFPNLVELSEILSQKEEIPLSVEEIEEIETHIEILFFNPFNNGFDINAFTILPKLSQN